MKCGELNFNDVLVGFWIFLKLFSILELLFESFENLF